MSQPTVTIKNGKLGGKISQNYDGDEYYSFQGIPYAKPPLGELRFKAPVPSESWEGIKDATKVGNDCIEMNESFEICPGSEDCLYLNVYTRNLPNKCKTLKPVMVWIHGGAFTMGSGSDVFYGPQFLMTKDVVLVTINYRVGIFGFLNFEDDSLGVTKNAGLKDSVLALKWVQENIIEFCGDPNNVTIFGGSAGGAAVHYLVLSPLTKGLFHKSIVQSGCAFCPWARGHRTLPYITKALELTTTNEKEVLEILQKMTCEELTILQKKIPDTLNPSYRRCFGPVIETSSPGAILTEDPEQIIESGNYNHAPMMIGFTSREGILAEIACSDTKSDYVVKCFEDKIPFTIDIPERSDLSKSIANKIKTFYYGQHQSCKENKSQLYLMYGDTTFAWPIILTVKLHQKTSNTPIFLYKFSVDSQISYLKNLMSTNVSGAGHGDDCGFIFKGATSPIVIPNSIEENVIKKIISLWTNFAIYGNPNLPSDSLSNIIWKPVDGEALHYMNIGEDLTVGVNPDENRMKFWEEIFDDAVKSTK